MKLAELITELKQKDSHKKFMTENPSSFVCAGFFILSSGEKEGDKVQINMFIPEKKRIATFDYPFNSFVEHADEIEAASVIDDLDLKLDLDELKDFIKDKLKITPEKIIAILKDKIWNITILNGMDMRRLKVDAYTEEILEESKGLLNDFMKFAPKKD